jgi:hypothetical protein
MKFPKIKNAVLCRILVYVLVLGGFIVPGALLFYFKDFLPLSFVVLGVLGLAIGLWIYLFKNAGVLIIIDAMLVQMHYYSIARKKFVLQNNFSLKRFEGRISLFGKEYEPTQILPLPHSVRYKCETPITVFTSGIEKVVLTYRVDFLDKETYLSIFKSANANSKALQGRKKPLFLDKAQKKSPLSRTTVIFIFAKRVDVEFKENLYKTVCQNNGDELNITVIPCVVDLEGGYAVFNSLCYPYMNQYPAKNRGVNMVRNILFGGFFTLRRSPDRIEMPKDYDPDKTLWSYWKEMKDMLTDQSDAKRRYEPMKHGEIVIEEDYIYLKWEDRGVWLFFELNEETKVAKVDAVRYWYYPRSTEIAKGTIKEIKSRISEHFAEMGYATKFADYE